MADEKITHCLLPEHEKISEKEKKVLLEKHNITFEQLPKILVTDPGLKGLEVKAYDIIKISRSSQVAGKAIYYRGVVNE